MKPVLEIQGLNQYFEKGTVNENHVLKGIDLQIQPGEFVSIIGGNGAGKSTLLNSIAGTFPISEGKIFLNGIDVTKQSVVKRSKYISRIFQDPKMGTAVRLSVEQNLSIAYCRGKKRGLAPGLKRKNHQMFKDKLATLKLGLEERLSTEMRLLSGGQRQAVTLMMATLQKPDLILLDEHIAALDPKTSRVVMELTDRLIHENQLTAFMVTHNMEDAIAYGNRLIMLHQGQIVIDLKNSEKQNLTVPALLEMFHEKSGTNLKDDGILLS